MINESNKNLLKAFPVLKQIPESEFDIWPTKYLTPMEKVIASYMKNIIYTNRGIGYTLPDGYIWEVKADENGAHITIVKGESDIDTINTQVVLTRPESKLYSIFSYNENDIIKSCKKSLNDIDSIANYDANFLIQEYDRLVMAGYKIEYMFLNSPYNMEDKHRKTEGTIEFSDENAKYSIDDFIIKDSKKIPDMIAEEKAKNNVSVDIPKNDNIVPMPNVGPNDVINMAPIPNANPNDVSTASLSSAPETPVNNANGTVSLFQTNNNLRKLEGHCCEHHSSILDLISDTVKKNGFGVNIVPAQFQQGLLSVFVLDQNGVPLFDRSFMIDIQGATLDPRAKWYPVVESPNMEYKGMIEFVYPAYALTNKKGEYVAEKDISSFINGRYSQDGNSYRRLYSDEEMSMFSWFAYRSLLCLNMHVGDKIYIFRKILKIFNNPSVKEAITEIQDTPLFVCSKVFSRSKFIIESSKSLGTRDGGKIVITYDEDKDPSVDFEVLRN